MYSQSWRYLYSSTPRYLHRRLRDVPVLQHSTSSHNFRTAYLPPSSLCPLSFFWSIAPYSCLSSSTEFVFQSISSRISRPPINQDRILVILVCWLLIPHPATSRPGSTSSFFGPGSFIKGVPRLITSRNNYTVRTASWLPWFVGSWFHI